MKLVATHKATLTWPIVVCCFFLSGFSGLLYQTVWMRQFGVVFGTAESSVVATLAAYMAGLGLGSYISGSIASKLARPLKVYVLLEIGIAIAALLVPTLIDLLQSLISKAVDIGAIDAQTISINLLSVYVLGTFAILMVPTALMGATLPVLLRLVITNDQDIGQRTSVLYGVNTTGAVFGTLVTAFLLLPTISLSEIILLGACINTLAAAGAFFLDSSASGRIVSELDRGKAKSTIFSRVILVAMCASGFASFCLEVTWTRLLSHIAGGSIYAFAVMLATFLTGIALGSLAAQLICTSTDSARRGFGWTQLGICLLSIVTYFFLGSMVPEERGWLSILALSSFVMLPVTLLIGATFPLAVRASVEDASETAMVAGKIYGFNTIGAIFGAFSAGFLLLPLLGFSGSVKFISVVSALIAFSVFSMLRSNRLGVITSSLMLVLVVAIPLSRPDAVIGASTINGNTVKGEELFYSVGRSATVFAKQYNGFINLRTNGLPEASIATKGSPPVRNSQQWLGALPLLANPAAKEIMVIGLGGGVALEGLPKEPDVNVTVVEIESEVVSANLQFEEERRTPVLDNENVVLVINDARSALTLSRSQYDIIVSQPSHPWTAGASHLYTEEFIALAKSRLTEGGVLLQWINAAFLDEELLRSVTTTLTSQFKSVLLFHPAPGVLEFLAADIDLEQRFSTSNVAHALKEKDALYSDVGIQSPLDVLAALALTNQGVNELANNSRPITDNFNRLATKSKSKGGGLAISDIIEITTPYDAICGGSEFKIGAPATDEFFYIQRQWMLSGFEERAAKCLDNQPLSIKAISTAYAMLVQGNHSKAVELLELAVKQPQSREAAAYLLAKFSLIGRKSSAIDAAEILSNPTAMATLDAWTFAQSNQWDRVEDLDKTLSKSAPKDVWYQDAAKLMAEWRIRKAIATAKPTYLKIALAIIDSALSSQWSEELLILRSGTGVLMQRPRLYLSSVDAYLNLISLRDPITTDTQNQKNPDEVTLNRLRGIESQLDQDWLQDFGPSIREIKQRISELKYATPR